MARCSSGGSPVGDEHTLGFDPGRCSAPQPDSGKLDSVAANSIFVTNSTGQRLVRPFGLKAVE